MSDILKQGTGSDTRMYNPRSESEEFMYGKDEEIYSPGDPEERELESQERKNEREEQQRKWTGLQHLKIKTGNKDEEAFEESTPQTEQTELSDLTGAAGSRGENLDQAVGARTGTGSALGEIPPQLPAMGAFGLTRSEPMDMAWDTLLKNYDDIFRYGRYWNEHDHAGESPYDDSESPYAQARNPTSDEERMAGILSGGTQLIDPDFDPKGDCCKTARERILNEVWGTPYEWGNGFEDNDGIDGTGGINPHYKGSKYPLDHYDCEELRNYITHEAQALSQSEFEPLQRMGENFQRILDDWEECEKQQTVSTDDENWQDTIEAGEPMQQAWDDLLIKVLGDPVGTETLESVDRKMRSGIGPGGVKGSKGHRIQAFPRPIGGRSPWASTKRRASVHQRLFGNIKGQGGKSLRSNSKTGMMRQRYTLSPHHLGVGSLVGKPRPGRLENPGKYISWLGRQSAYRGAGGSGVMLPYTPHAPREQLGQLGYPGQAGSGRMRLMPGQAQAMRQGPSRALRGPPKPRAPRIAKAELEELVEVSKAYVRQLGPGLTSFDSHDLKDLLRELKHLLSRLPRKSLMGISGGGSNNDGMVEAPSNGPQKTSRNEGGTETDPDDDPRYWGADPAGQYTRRGGSNV